MNGKRVQGRRVSEQARPGRRFPAALVVGLAAVAVAAASLSVQEKAEEAAQATPEAPRTRPLTSLSVLCPAAVPDSTALVVGSGAPEAEADGSGEVTRRNASASDIATVDLDAGSVATVDDADDPVMVTGTGDLAPGLFGARFGATDTPAAGECLAPSSERWFAGVGAGGPHTSHLLLANPDTGPAVADVTLWNSAGEVVEVESRGLTIPGEKSSLLDLAELSPNRDELTVRVTVSRGRVAATMSDSYAPVGEDPVDDWLPATAAPATQQIIPGLPRTMKEPTLTVANPGEDAGRVTIKVVGGSSTFSPQGLEEIRVPAGESVTAEIPESVVALLKEEDAGLRLESSVPITGSLRALVVGDLVHLPAAEPSTDTAAALPGGSNSTVVLSAQQQAGRVTLRFLGATDTSDKQVKVRLKPTTSTAVPVPDGASAVVVSGSKAHVGAVRTVTADGASSLPLRPLQLEQLIPSVRPEWP